jgi:hypothetical protein
MSHGLSPTTNVRPAFLDRLRRDEDGAIMVIAVFMAAVLVGAIWYTWGLGEAMLYRQQLRQAADASAFDSAVLHALGMNMIAMINITMAAVLSVLVALMVVFVGAIVCTLIALALLAIPGVDIVDAEGLAALLDFDDTMYNLISNVAPKIQKALTWMNTSEGIVAIAMPWAGFVASLQSADEYGGAVQSTWATSLSMIPLRLPYYSDKLDAYLKEKLPVIPGYNQQIHPTRIPLLARYGLPVQDDVFGMLCMHAGMELVDELALLLQALTLNSLPIEKVAKPVSQWFGMAVGTMPWLFCSGVEPLDAAADLIGDAGVPKFLLNFLLPPIVKSTPVLNKIGDDKMMKDIKDLTHGWDIFPMKPFDESSNGSAFMQVYSSASGSPTVGTGAITGVAVAGWTPVATTDNSGADSNDFAEAEFYYDCGNPADSDDQMVVGTDDTNGGWQECKYNAMWNMRWKTRLRRYHQCEWDVRKDIELSLWQGTGFDKFVQSVLPPPIAQGSLAKTQALDKAKACFTSVGAGSTSGTGDFGGCPWPIGDWFSFPNGGKVGLNSGTPDGYPMSAVLH